MMSTLLTWVIFQGVSIKAMALSLLLPGAGELMLGYPKAAVPFFGVEVATWTTAFALHQYTSRIQEEYTVFAYQFAGANIHRKDEAYWKAVEFYLSHEAYIEALLIEARSYFPDNYEQQLAYVRSKDPGGDWSWDVENHWYRFQELRQRFRALQDWTTVSLGVLVGNRIASMINVFLLSRYGKKMRIAFRGRSDGVTAQLQFSW